MEVEIEGIGEGGGRMGEGTHLPDQGEDDREGVAGGGCERDVEDVGGVDYSVNCC